MRVVPSHVVEAYAEFDAPTILSRKKRTNHPTPIHTTTYSPVTYKFLYSTSGLSLILGVVEGGIFMMRELRVDPVNISPPVGVEPSRAVKRRKYF